MVKLFKFILNLLIYAGIVVGIVWGLPAYLSNKFGTEYPIAAITSGSMWPALKEGDLILIEAVPREEIALGDVIVWQNEKGFTIHRVAKLNARTLVTKGDANFTNDEPIGYEEVIGRTVLWREKPVRVPYLGYVAKVAGQVRASRSTAAARN